ncbi:hypothetical protein BJ508DRAFT_325734 [Ascobolus immersus RN42]|uniref:F-box domain-containing protein n=1 Tax=Ascobolus immersus RN42 TaxID=1160509 RepID=A0A3N4IC17_ASCIM|nr:hypothetical protein BJ508DRAFT_325734 [Ascobolus immersus RN42]
MSTPQTVAPQTTILSLPNELLDQIAILIQDVPTYMSLMRASRRLCQVTRHLFVCTSFLTNQYLLHDTGPQSPSRPTGPSPETSIFTAVIDKFITILQSPPCKRIRKYFRAHLKKPHLSYRNARFLLHLIHDSAPKDLEGEPEEDETNQRRHYSRTKVARVCVPTSWFWGLLQVHHFVSERSREKMMVALARVWLVEGMARAFDAIGDGNRIKDGLWVWKHREQMAWFEVVGGHRLLDVKLMDVGYWDPKPPKRRKVRRGRRAEV